MGNKKTPKVIKWDQDPCIYGLLTGVAMSRPVSLLDPRLHTSTGFTSPVLRKLSIDGKIRAQIPVPMVPEAETVRERSYTSEEEFFDAPMFPEEKPQVLPYLFSEKFEFVSSCEFNDSKYAISFKSYFPTMFHQLRKFFTQTAFHKNGQSLSQAELETDYFDSFASLAELVCCGELANSGSRFYYTPDRKYVMKTLPHSQVKFLVSILNQYGQYVLHHPNTSLTRIFALYRVKWSTLAKKTYCGKKDQGKVYVIVMLNGLQHSDNQNVLDDVKIMQSLDRSTQVFDMKAFGLKHPRDNRDLVKWMESNTRIRLTEKDKELLEGQLKRDVEFLSSIGINDYSLLVGIRPITAAEKEHVYSHLSEDGKYVYYLIFIDVLSPWHTMRRIGNYVMPGVFLFFPRYTRPKKYAKRMFKTIETILE